MVAVNHFTERDDLAVVQRSWTNETGCAKPNAHDPLYPHSAAKCSLAQDVLNRCKLLGNTNNHEFYAEPLDEPTL